MNDPVTDPMTDPGADPGLGARLAAWLDQLGLTDLLTEAGLPTPERDLAGVVRWRDSDTGLILTPDQLAGLDRLLRQQGEDPLHAVPVPLVQLRRQVAVRAALLDSPTLDYAGLAARRGVSENAARFAAHKEAARHRLLLVSHEHDGAAAVLIPAFQLDHRGELREELGAVLEPLSTAGMDPWRIWGWLTQPAALLGGQVPERAATDPEEVAIVRHAAVRLAERASRPAETDPATPQS